MLNQDYLASELRKLGLDKRGADTYLTLLSINGATAAQIAVKLGFSRPTAYRVLKNLQEKELVTENRRKTRRVFMASSPDRFLGILKIQRRRAEEQEREFLRIISILQTKHRMLADKNEIKTYNGRRERKLIMEDLALTGADEIKVIFSSAKLPEMKELERVYERIKKRKATIKIKEIYPQNVEPSALDYVERISVPTLSGVPARVLVIADKACLFYLKKVLCVEKQPVIRWFEFLFELAGRK